MENNSLIIPVLPLRGLTAFPKMLLHFDVGRAISLKALERAMKDNQTIFLVAQEKLANEKITFNDLYKIGTVCEIKQILKIPSSESVRVLVEGKRRGIISKEIQTKSYLTAEITYLDDAEIEPKPEQKQAIVRTMLEKFDEYLDFQPKISSDIFSSVVDKKEPQDIADFIAQNIPLEYTKKQKLLEELHPVKRSIKLIEILTEEIEVLTIEEDLAKKVKAKVDKNQKEYYLREQLKVVLEELGESESVIAEYQKYLDKIVKLGLSETDEEKLISEANKMRKLGSSSQEGGVIRNYLDFVVSLPFNKQTKDKTDILKAKKVLDNDHYGMEKVKERILESLALRIVSESKKGSVICLVGPPGVGKTSIASSVSRALGRKMARVSLGGVKDESEIRGHRKTYVGAMSGKIIKAVKTAGTKNPLILLDEIDKMASDMRGDPASAMLEVLDFEQNHTFMDHYLEIPFDLSNTIFIATANNLGGIPKPLLDRMEVINLSSYTALEKFYIGKDYIIPKKKKQYKLSKVKFSDDAINDMIKEYTKESGVRKLEQTVDKVLRKVAYKMVTEGLKSVTIDNNLTDYLGKPIYTSENFSKKNEIGIVNGLAYTTVGGEILKVEVNALNGDGKIQLTGNLGNVMKESANIAISYIRSVCDKFAIEDDFYKKKDIHIHFPEGAVPKDGPSAGITMATAIVSALTKREVKHNIAMTGEISLRGNVMPIGGLKEKSMAAYTSGIEKIIISKENIKDLEEIDKEVLANIEFIPVTTMDEVLKYALVVDETKEFNFISEDLIQEAVMQ